MPYDDVLCEKKEHVATVWLNRPEKLNPLSRRHLEEIGAAVEEMDADPEIRVIVLAGKGRAFSAGADFSDLGKLSGARAPSSSTPPHPGAGVLRTLHGARSITIAAVQGYAIGGGLSLVMACDLRLAAEGTVFFIPEVDLGVPYFWGSTALLVEAVGLCKAKELILTCDRFSAEQALEFGLLNRVVPADQLLPDTFELADQISKKAPVVIEEVKKMSNGWLFRRLEELEPGEEARILARVLSESQPNPYRENLLKEKTRES